MNNNITHRQVMDRAGNRIEPPPMATYCEPSQRAIIRARDQQDGQRLDRDRREAMALLRVLDQEPRRERPAELPAHHAAPEPVLNAEFVAGLIAGLAFSGLAAAALLLGDRL